MSEYKFETFTASRRTGTGRSGNRCPCCSHLSDHFCLQVGIKVNVSVFENAVISDKIGREHGHDMYACTWGMQTSRDPGVYWHMAITSQADGTTNVACISDPEIDKLMDEQNLCVNDVKRNEIFQKIWDRMNDLHPWIYLCQADELNGAQKDLIGLEDLLDGKINLLTNLHYPEQERLK